MNCLLISSSPLPLNFSVNLLKCPDDSNPKTARYQATIPRHTHVLPAGKGQGRENRSVNHPYPLPPNRILNSNLELIISPMRHIPPSGRPQDHLCMRPKIRLKIKGIKPKSNRHKPKFYE
jgi:hypothetical protein